MQDVVSSDDNLAARIADQLRRDILRGALNPGDAVKERENAAALGVSRTPMREAIRILAQEGLVVLRPARSPIVADPDKKALGDQVQVLTALEKLSAELACLAATQDELDHIAQLAEDIEAGGEGADPIDVFEADMAFHTAIAKASHNETLADLHRSILGRLWRARFLSARRSQNRTRAIAHHAAIVRALMARDPVAAAIELNDHLCTLEVDLEVASSQ